MGGNDKTPLSRMKVAILTFHNTTNYGALLQTYALQKTIMNCYSCQCDVIDYHNHVIESRELPMKPHFTGNGKSYIVQYLLYLGRVKKKKRMRSFESFIRLSESCNSEKLGKVCENYDKIIVGSDIVWEPNVTGGDLAYFLDFAPEYKRYSYAASFGVDSFPEDLKNACGKLLKGYNQISVREKSGVDIVKQLSSREAEHVLDPTFLLDESEWRQVFDFIPKIKKYILIYFADKEGTLLGFAKKLSKETGMKIVMIHEGIKRIKGVHSVRNCSVQEFLGWIANSSIVLTASYHGVAFAVNFHKEFYYFNRAHTERMKSLASTLELTRQEVLSTTLKRNKPDYKVIEKNLEDEKKKSYHFLDKCLAGGHENEYS